MNQSPPPYAPIESYAPIGDGRTVALVGADGCIDWLPLPGLGARPVFSRLLDTEHGGSILLQPDESFEASREYVAGTNVLQTVFVTASGSVRVTDAMVSGVAGRLPWAQLARRIDGIEGSVPMRWHVRPGTSWDTAAPWMHCSERGQSIRCGTMTMAVLGADHGPGEPDHDGPNGPVLRGAFNTTPDSRHLLTLVATDGEPLHLPDPRVVDDGIDRTIAAWQDWSSVFSYDGPWAEQVQRSALALKLLIYSPTGAIAAAATSSLPENLEGGKNWDYRYAWVRDLAYTAHALVRFGLREETHAALSWLLRTIRESGPQMCVMYSLDGDGVPGPRTFDVPGWRGIGPVVDGNPAQDQLQLGAYGDLFAICRTYADAGNLLDVQTGRLLAEVADRVCDLWRNPDSGIWELQDLRHYTCSKISCWKALDDAVALCELGAIPGEADRWRAERARIRTWVEEHCWSETLQSYVFVADEEELDASILLHAPTGFDRGERMSKTIDAVTAELGAGSLLYRYTGMQKEEKTFVACAFWRAQALACVGRHEEAVTLIDELLPMANDVGIFAEMIDPDDGSAWGNTPQALSHLGLINAVLTIAELAPDDLLAER